MIRRTFLPPNLLCTITVQAEGAQDEQLLVHATSEADARARLEADGFVVKKMVAYDFQDWKNRATSSSGKAAKAPAAGKSRQFDPEIWGELKNYLFNLFDGKCAYCESKVLDVASGDVEHYRPKKKVDENPAHPGYYWLAYEPLNLFPCCEKCNRARAKMNHFPVAKMHLKVPGKDLSSEGALLLNPYEDDPREHIKFLPSARVQGPQGRFFPGTVAGMTDQGKMSVEIYNLNRSNLVIARRVAQQTIRNSIKLSVANDTVRTTMARLRSGSEEHSVSCLAEVAAQRQELLADLSDDGT